MQISFLPFLLGFSLPTQGAVANLESLSYCSEIDLRKAAEGTECLTRANVMFKLIKRTEAGNEVWKDLKSGKLWSDTYDRLYTPNEALARHWARDKVKACEDPTFADFRGNLTDANFQMPTRKDFSIAYEHGFEEVLPNMEKRVRSPYQSGPEYIDVREFMTSSSPKTLGKVWSFCANTYLSGYEDKWLLGTCGQENWVLVRCVADPN
ncbi:MAG: hypothetical protein AAB425_12695 [Bdellovibrionota bacterium]|mgnify:CR=1 FL=1